jgi:hypothetical protein
MVLNSLFKPRMDTNSHEWLKYLSQRHPERSEGSKVSPWTALTAWILRFAQDDGSEDLVSFV